MGVDAEVQVKIRQLNSQIDKVAYILDRFVETRNNDFYLEYLYLKYVEHLPLPYLSFDVFQRVKGLDNVGRLRRKLNEQGLYMPTDPEVYEKRQAASEAMKKAIHSRKLERA